MDGECSGSILTPLLMFLFFILLFTDGYWGPGLRNILNAVAERISGRTVTTEPQRGKARFGIPMVTLLVGLPVAAWAALQIWRSFS